jgi:hypothetical protein
MGQHCQYDSAVDADEQPLSQLLFELPNLPADSRLTDIQFLCCRGEALTSPSDFEGT